jgi:hypothetical protein
MDRWLLALAVVVLVGGAWYASRRLRESPHAPDRVDPEDFGLGGEDGVAAVVFSSPYCLGCREWTQALRDTSTPHRVVDVRERPDLARRYRVRHTPLVLAVRGDSGEVAAAYDAEPTAGDVNHVAALVAG